ncbi:SPARC-related modular calcium-binding protein 1-like isoform X2 [Tubulanus polymorphus]|uniref:SPARC-related modular calcium-binding protein 1-like isoform X2 n=1 Tax=Tubulanus polymorphus TaxID=672921 RepID=UPI003DA32BFC
MEHRVLSWNTLQTICLTGFLVFSYTEGLQQISSLRFRRSTNCSVNCTQIKPREVCASDGRTYQSRCEILRLKTCEKRPIKVIRKGKCSDPTRCQEEKLKAEKSQQQSDGATGAGVVGIYIPNCEADGSFSKVQCHQATGYCWCVNKEGKPIPGTSVKGKKPKCQKQGKKRKKRLKGKKGCNQTDRSTFNSNLVNLFKKEYHRLPKDSQPKLKQSGITDTFEKRVIEWKFSEMDKNRDNRLKKSEIRSLTRMIRRHVKPKRCARDFMQYCDIDSDSRIARSEWSVCLGVDINNVKQVTARPLITPEKKSTISKLGDLSGGAAAWLDVGTDEEEEEDTDNTEETKDCAHERKVALENHRTDPNGNIFIPKCSAAGKFQSTQCHESTGYCWCADENTGVPIAGTSTFKVTPSCENINIRIMKDCPPVHRRRFITAQLDKMTKDMVEYANNNTGTRKVPDPDPKHSIEEQAIRWKLHMLDENNNMMIDRRERRNLKLEIRSNKDVKGKKSLRKCARNFVKFCDANNNKKITIDEWVDCMGIHDKKLPKQPKRKGPNPFIQQLTRR